MDTCNKLLKHFPRIISLVVGCLGMMTCSSIFSIGAYINALKKQFNYTQSDVEVFGSMNNFGLCFGIPAGIMCEKCTPPWISLTALLISAGGFLLLWSTTFTKEFYSNKPELQDVYFFLTGFGSIFVYMVSLTTNIENFDIKHRGKVIGLLDACFSAGTAIFAFLYGAVFTEGHIEDEENQNLKGFYLMSAVVYIVVCLLGMLLLKKVALDLDNQSNETQTKSASIKPKARELTGLKLVVRTDFHFVFWPFLFCASLQLMFINNIGVCLKSFDAEQYTTIFTTLNPICAVVFKFAVGYLSDVLINKCPRVTLLLGINIIQTIFMVISIFFADNIAFLVTTVVVIGFANGAIWCLTPTIVSEEFGMEFFARNWGSIQFGNAFAALATQRAFGAIYDSYIETKGSKDCYGLRCFTWSFAMAAALSFCSCVFNVGLLQGKLEEKKYFANKKDNTKEDIPDIQMATRL